MQLLNEHQRVVRTVYYTQKVKKTKGNNIYGKVALIPKSKSSQTGYPLKQAYQHAHNHYQYHLDLTHHQASLNFQGHHLIFEHMQVNNGSWIKKSPVEPLKGYPGSKIEYYRYFYLDDY